MLQLPTLTGVIPYEAEQAILRLSQQLDAVEATLRRMPVVAPVVASPPPPSSPLLSQNIVVQTLTIAGLTAGRVPYVGPSGTLLDSADLTFAVDTLVATKLSTPALISAAALTITPAVGQPLTVTTSAGGYVNLTGGFVGINNAAPARWLDILTGATTSSGFHLGEALNEGGYFRSLTPDELTIGGGAEYVAGNWTARATTASILVQYNGLTSFYGDTGLTSGNTFTPTERARIDASGRLGIGVTTVGGWLALKAGAAAAGFVPLLFASGTNATTPVNGAMEYNGTNLFFTPSAATRLTVNCSVNGAAAPATNAIGIILDYFGTSATRVLTTPDSWEVVTIDGTVYKRPLYL